MLQLWWLKPETLEETPDALALLTPEERTQHQRFIPPLKRHEYLATRVLVKTVLGRTLGIAREEVRFTTNQWGRPELLRPLPNPLPRGERETVSQSLRFNITHTEGLIALLLSDEYELGIDTERLARAPRLLALAPNVFAPSELSDLAALPSDQQAHRALTLWTLKESYIKARGLGLYLPLDSFSFGVEDGITLACDARCNDDPARWAFAVYALAPALTMAVAVERAPGEAAPSIALERTVPLVSRTPVELVPFLRMRVVG